eukprot:gene8216-biopygen6899
MRLVPASGPFTPEAQAQIKEYLPKTALQFHQCGIGSRRGCEQIILEGRVSINGREVKDLATKVEPEDKVVVDG